MSKKQSTEQYLSLLEASLAFPTPQKTTLHYINGYSALQTNISSFSAMVEYVKENQYIVFDFIKTVKKFMHQIKYIRKAATILILRSKANSTRSPRRTSKSAKTSGSSTNSLSGDPDPAPSYFYYLCFKFIISLFIFLSSLCKSFVATSTYEVTE